MGSGFSSGAASCSCSRDSSDCIPFHTSCDLTAGLPCWYKAQPAWCECSTSFSSGRCAKPRGCVHVLQGLGVILEVQRDLAEESVYFQVSRAANSAPRRNIQHSAYMQMPVAKVPGMTSRLAR